MLMGMVDFIQIAAAVFAGSIMAASFLWGMSRLHRSDERGMTYAAVLFPLAFFIGAMVIA
jgi:hypothetical protein